ncbi:hypothetical protein RHGRI_036311 [Rhododendron griersonianum]|uniref:Uncharacterized protein n=1 Tax=Rhododendron griersonianum TaxID=479676 RepID=A0AAV6HSY3_9ERIC|nr:hypothetical protein RHGRI_036311 [Rhododendron griersonianum]
MKGFAFAGVSRNTTAVLTFAGADLTRWSEKYPVADLFSGRGAEASLPYSRGVARCWSEGLYWRGTTEATGNGKRGVFSPLL